MSRGGRRGGASHLPVESCHSLASWGAWQSALMWGGDEDEIEWEFGEKVCAIITSIEGRETRQEIELTFTRCAFGGVRCWFICPGCGLRVGRIYLPVTMYAGGRRVSYFRCRHCYSLTYLQRQDRDLYWCYIKRAERIAARWLGEFKDGMIYAKPGQHYKTFEKRCAQYNDLVRRSDAEMVTHASGPLGRMLRDALAK